MDQGARYRHTSNTVSHNGNSVIHFSKEMALDFWFIYLGGLDII